MLNAAQIIKARVTTRDYLRTIGIEPDRHGMICCPIHGEKTPSLKVYDDPRRGWHCFGCHAGGDVIDMVCKVEGVTFVEALKRLDEAFDLGLPFSRPIDKEARKRAREEIDRINRAREKQREAERDAEQQYWAAYDRWLSNENTIMDCAPKSIQDEITEEFAYAVTHRTELREAMEDAEDEWRRVRRARYCDTGRKMAQA